MNPPKTEPDSSGADSNEGKPAAKVAPALAESASSGGTGSSALSGFNVAMTGSVDNSVGVFAGNRTMGGKESTGTAPAESVRPVETPIVTNDVGTEGGDVVEPIKLVSGISNPGVSPSVPHAGSGSTVAAIRQSPAAPTQTVSIRTGSVGTGREVGSEATERNSPVVSQAGSSVPPQSSGGDAKQPLNEVIVRPVAVTVNRRMQGIATNTTSDFSDANLRRSLGTAPSPAATSVAPSVMEYVAEGGVVVGGASLVSTHSVDAEYDNSAAPTDAGAVASASEIELTASARVTAVVAKGLPVTLTETANDGPAIADRLGFTPYVNGLCDFLRDPKTLPPLTISIEGEWGSGKSSFMRQLRKRLEDPALPKRDAKWNPLVIEFSPWRHASDEALWASFAIAFMQKCKPKKLRSRIRLAWKLSWQSYGKTERWFHIGLVGVATYPSHNGRPAGLR